VGPTAAMTIDAGHVVLTAGAIGTARLLLQSGIGPGGQIADLPVGQHCWDHPEWIVPTDWKPTGHGPVLEAVLNHADLEIRPYTTGFDLPSLGIGVALMRPRARGRVTSERIEHRYDSEPGDIAALRDGCELVGEIIGGAAGEPVWSTSQHLSGTAPMGTGDDAVVDRQLRVHGVGGLSVADGSILPAPLSRGPHATIAMIGHRAADFL
jgi:choline dehydrogenase